MCPMPMIVEPYLLPVQIPPLFASPHQPLIFTIPGNRPPGYPDSTTHESIDLPTISFHHQAARLL
jgi:hypothetical protein